MIYPNSTFTYVLINKEEYNIYFQHNRISVDLQLDDLQSLKFNLRILKKSRNSNGLYDSYVQLNEKDLKLTECMNSTLLGSDKSIMKKVIDILEVGVLGRDDFMKLEDLDNGQFNLKIMKIIKASVSVILFTCKLKKENPITQTEYLMKFILCMKQKEEIIQKQKDENRTLKSQLNDLYMKKVNLTQLNEEKEATLLSSMCSVLNQKKKQLREKFGKVEMDCEIATNSVKDNNKSVSHFSLNDL